MATWGWSRLVPFVLGQDGAVAFPHIKRFTDEISARPAAQRALALKDKHAFKTEMDDEARLAMFPHLKKAS
jgi:GST-like protein